MLLAEATALVVTVTVVVVLVALVKELLPKNLAKILGNYMLVAAAAVITGLPLYRLVVLAVAAKVPMQTQPPLMARPILAAAVAAADSQMLINKLGKVVPASSSFVMRGDKYEIRLG